MFWGNHGWGMGFGWVFMVFFWVLVIAGVIYLIQLIAKGSKSGSQENREIFSGVSREDSALDILKKRYARGEITKDEFEKLRDDLTKT